MSNGEGHRGDPFTHVRKPTIRAPKMRFPSKNALNAPVVTVFGAGIAGLTAAHELVERGCRVYVVEKEEDLNAPGQPQIGGMAASQFGRVRAGVEAVHPNLFDPPPHYPLPDDLKEWLLKIFLFNRTAWIQSDKPVVFPDVFFKNPKDPSSGDLLLKYRSGKPVDGELRALVQQVKQDRRDQWLWDLTCRGFYIGYVDRQRDDVHTLPDATSQNKQSENDLKKFLAQLRGQVSPGTDGEQALAALRESLSPFHFDEADVRIAFLLSSIDQTIRAKLPSHAAQRVEIFRRMIEEISRDFLLIRVTPCWCPPDEIFADREGQNRTLDDLQKETAGRLRQLSRAAQSMVEGFACGANFDFDSEVPKKFAPNREEGHDYGDVWLQLEIVEERVPGEHGYRFFPAFYRHLDDTMGRIPTGVDGMMVVDNLESTTVQGLGIGKGELGNGRPKRPIMVEFGRGMPSSLTQLWENTMGFVKRVGGTVEDAALFHAKITEFITSSSERRRKKYQKTTWSQFIELARFSGPMQKQLMAAAQALLAFSVGEADACSYGDVAVQLLLDNMSPSGKVDRTLNGPTTDAFLAPWRTHLENEGVKFLLGELTTVRFPSGPGQGDLVPEIKLAVDSPDRDEIVKSDFFVLALSAGATKQIVDAAYTAANGDFSRAPEFGNFQTFWRESGFGSPTAKKIGKGDGPLRDMTGMQFYFDGKTRVGQGHVYYPMSPWGLSTISQSEFWKRKFTFSDGFYGVLSIDLCDLAGKVPGPMPADFVGILSRGADDQRASKFFAALEVWKQLKSRIAPPSMDGAAPNGDSGLEFPRFFHVDKGLTLNGDNEWINETPFMATTPGSWVARPGLHHGRIEYQVNFDRWVLCGTHAATYTRLTTMEAANESARHAVGAILRQLSAPGNEPEWDTITVSDHPHSVYFGGQRLYNGASSSLVYDFPEIFPIEDREPADLGPIKRVDKALLDQGLPHFMEILRIPDRIHHALLGFDLAMDTRTLSTYDDDDGGYARKQEALPWLKAGWNLYQELDREIEKVMGGGGVPKEVKNLVERAIRFLETITSPPPPKAASPAGPASA
jgi:hypothetical protein